MNIPRCPHLDQFTRQLVDAYRRAGEHDDLLGLLTGGEAPNEIEVAHLAMAQHRQKCPICRKIDRARPREKAVFNRFYPIPKMRSF